MAEELFTPFRPSREGAPALDSVRSTLIGSSVLSLRGRGLEARYLALLDPRHRDAILYTPAGIWLPIEVALAHYAACDRLELPAHDILAIGSDVAKVTQKSVLASVLRIAKEVGATPWTLYANCDKYWARIFHGSAVGIYKLGPKEARVEIVACGLCASAYWRTGLRGLLGAVSEPFAQKVYVRVLAALATSTTCGYRVSWV